MKYLIYAIVTVFYASLGSAADTFDYAIVCTIKGQAEPAIFIPLNKGEDGSTPVSSLSGVISYGNVIESLQCNPFVQPQGVDGGLSCTNENGQISVTLSISSVDGILNEPSLNVNEKAVTDGVSCHIKAI